MTDQTQPHYVGIDVSKLTLDYALTGTVEGQVPNTAEGYRRLLEQLRPLGGARVICESTGGYERGLVAALWAAGLEVCVVQPGRAPGGSRKAKGSSPRPIASTPSRCAALGKVWRCTSPSRRPPRWQCCAIYSTGGARWWSAWWRSGTSWSSRGRR